MTAVHLEGHGFLTAEGRYYPEATVRAALLSICEWWAGLSDAERAKLRKQRGIRLETLTVDRTAEMDATVRWMSQRGQSATDIAQALGMSVAYVANARKRSAS